MERAREFLDVAELVVDEKDQDASFVDKAQYGFLAMSVPEVRKVMRAQVGWLSSLQES